MAFLDCSVKVELQFWRKKQIGNSYNRILYAISYRWWWWWWWWCLLQPAPENVGRLPSLRYDEMLIQFQEFVDLRWNLFSFWNFVRNRFFTSPATTTWHISSAVIHENKSNLCLVLWLRVFSRKTETLGNLIEGWTLCYRRKWLRSAE